jgi:hypothetical protein
MGNDIEIIGWRAVRGSALLCESRMCSVRIRTLCTHQPFLALMHRLSVPVFQCGTPHEFLLLRFRFSVNGAHI